MARTIGLNIQLNGLNGVVKDIKTLEIEIKKAREDLKELEIGSDLFSQLSQEIGLAETQLLGLIQSTKRLTKEREIEGIGKLGQGIASSFAAAQASVALFGEESEEVQKAATAAQNLLTLALSARGIAEVRLGAQLVARTIAQRAATAADAAQIGVLKQLYALIAANPYTALLAVLGALVAAYFALGNEEEKTAEKTKTLNELLVEQQSAIKGQITSIELLKDILNDTNSSLDAQEGAYIKLQKLIPDLAVKNFELKGSQDEINNAINREIKLIELRAKQKAAEQFLVEQETKKLKDREAQRERFLKGLSVEIAQEQLRLAQAGQTNEQIQESIEGYKLIRLSQAGFTEESVNLKDITLEIIKLEKEQKDIIDRVKTSTDNSKKSNEKRLESLRALAENLRTQIKLQNEILTQEVELGDADAKILDNLKERIERAKNLTEATNKLKTGQQLLLEVERDIANVSDKIGETFIKATDSSETFFDNLKNLTGTPAEKQKKLNDELENYRKTIEEIRASGNLTPELERELNNIQRIYENVVKGLSKVVEIDPPFDVEKWEKTLVNFNLRTGAILTDPYKRTKDEIAKEISTAEEEYLKIRKEYINKFTQVELEKRREALKPLQDAIRKSAVGSADRLALEKEYKGIVDEITNAAEKSFKSLEKQGTEILQYEDGIRRVNGSVKVLNDELSKLQDSARLGFVVENADELAGEFQGVFNKIKIGREDLSALQEKLAKKDFSVDEKYAGLLTTLQEKLQDELNFIDKEGNVQSIDISKLSYEERLALLEKFLKKEVELVENAEEDKEKARQKSLERFSEGLQIFSDGISEIASIESQFTQLRLDKLEQESNATLETIVGDSEAAAKKREEVEKQFQLQKAQIEKAAVIKSLELQLLMATADAAQAVVSNLENPVVAAIAGIVGAFQIAIIAKQLELARSAAGGMILSGPSHEKGGIKVGGGLEVEGGESIINRVSTVNYQGMLSSINQAGGGQALVNNATNSLMEERLLQAIAKTKQEPIRAYVLNSEITNGQAINKRLEELSTI